MPQITVIMDSDEHRLLQGMRRLADQQAKLEGGFKRVDQSRQGAFGEAAGREISAFVTQLGASLVSLNAIKSALDDLIQKRREAAEFVKSAERGFGSLAELAMGDTGELAKLHQASRDVYLKGGASSLDAAARLVYQLKSADAMSELPLFTRLFDTFGPDTEQLVGAATTMRTGFGREEAGSFRQLIAKAQVAGAPVRASAAGILDAAAQNAQLGGMLGFTDEEILAATTALTRTAGSTGEGGTQLQALLKALIENNAVAPGMSLQGALSQVGGLGLNQQQLQKWFGRVEGFKGFVALSSGEGGDLYKKTLGEVQAANSGEILDRTIRSNERMPMTVAARMARMAKARNEIGQVGIGIEEAAVQARLDDAEAVRRASGESELSNWLQRKLDAGLDAVLTSVGNRSFREGLLDSGPGGVAAARMAANPWEAMGRDEPAIETPSWRARMGRAMLDRQRELGLIDGVPDARVTGERNQQFLAGMERVIGMLEHVVNKVNDAAKGMAEAAQSARSGPSGLPKDY